MECPENSRGCQLCDSTRLHGINRGVERQTAMDAGRRTQGAPRAFASDRLHSRECFSYKAWSRKSWSSDGLTHTVAFAMQGSQIAFSHDPHKRSNRCRAARGAPQRLARFRTVRADPASAQEVAVPARPCFCSHPRNVGSAAPPPPGLEGSTGIPHSSTITHGDRDPDLPAAGRQALDGRPAPGLHRVVGGQPGSRGCDPGRGRCAQGVLVAGWFRQARRGERDLLQLLRRRHVAARDDVRENRG